MGEAMEYEYDPANIFARILRGEIPNRTVLETAHSLAFHDVNPRAPVHVLVIPKGDYVNYDHFLAAASTEEVLDFNQALLAVCEQTKLLEDGYRMITNAGESGMQEVPHMHMHILAGKPLGPMLAV